MKHTEETKQKISKTKMGSIPWNKGIKLPYTTWNKGIKYTKRLKRNFSAAQKKRFEKESVWNKGLRGYLAGEKHYAWKGQDVSYRNLHKWVERMIGKPNRCTNCGKIGYGRQMHWANKSRNYKRELTDWVRLCIKCHKAYDRNKLVLK